MSYELAIINPRTAPKRRRATAKQLAARRRFIKRFAKGRKSRTSAKFSRDSRGRIFYTRNGIKKPLRRVPSKRRKSKPIYSGVSVMAKRRKKSRGRRNAKGHFVKRTHKSTARRTRRRRASSGARRAAAGYTVGSGKIRRRKLNPRASRRRRYHRNPLGMGSLSVKGIVGQLVPAAYGAGGAIALNLALSYLPLPDVLKTGWPRHLTRLAGAMAVGMAARKFLGRRGDAVGFGALTVVVYDIVKGLIATASPDLGARLGDFEDVTLDDGGFIDPASPVRGFAAYLEGTADDSDSMGAYLQGNLDGNLDGVGDFHYA
jgi:hypothetical protein